MSMTDCRAILLHRFNSSQSCRSGAGLVRTKKDGRPVGQTFFCGFVYLFGCGPNHFGVGAPSILVGIGMFTGGRAFDPWLFRPGRSAAPIQSNISSEGGFSFQFQATNTGSPPRKLVSLLKFHEPNMGSSPFPKGHFKETALPLRAIS